MVEDDYYYPFCKYLVPLQEFFSLRPGPIRTVPGIIQTAFARSSAVRSHNYVVFVHMPEVFGRNPGTFYHNSVASVHHTPGEPVHNEYWILEQFQVHFGIEGVAVLK